MCLPRLFSLNIAHGKVVADAADASYSSRRESNPHWILHTSEVEYFQEKEEAQEIVEFVRLQVANGLLFWSNRLGDAYNGKIATPSVIRDSWRLRGKTNPSGNSRFSTEWRSQQSYQLQTDNVT